MNSLTQRFANPFKVIRKGQGIYQDGFYVAGPDETICVNGSMQPVSGMELKIVEEGNRFKDYFYFFTDLPIMTDNYKSLAGGDRIVIDGQTYKVLNVMRWTGSRLDHYQSTVVREPEQR